MCHRPDHFDLVVNLSSAQVFEQFEAAGCTEFTCQTASGLGRDARGHALGRRDQHAFHHLASAHIKRTLDGAIAAELLVGDFNPAQFKRLVQTLSKSLGQIAHLLERTRPFGPQPFFDLFRSKRLFAQFHNSRFELNGIQGSDVFLGHGTAKIGPAPAEADGQRMEGASSAAIGKSVSSRTSIISSTNRWRTASRLRTAIGTSFPFWRCSVPLR